MTQYVVKVKKVRKVGRKVTLSLYYVTGGGVSEFTTAGHRGEGGQKVAKIRSRGKKKLPKGIRLLIF